MINQKFYLYILKVLLYRYNVEGTKTQAYFIKKSIFYISPEFCKIFWALSLKVEFVYLIKGFI